MIRKKKNPDLSAATIILKITILPVLVFVYIHASLVLIFKYFLYSRRCRTSNHYDSFILFKNVT